MFRSIRGVLDKKKSNFIKTGEKNSDINRVFSKFLNEYFIGYGDLFKWEISYNSEDGKVVINTGSKLIAGELSLRIKEFSRLLKDSNLKITQIVIV